MARKRADYSKLIDFAMKHPELSRTAAIEEFRKSGGKAQKKAGLEALRQSLNVGIGKSRGVKIGNISPPKNATKKSPNAPQQSKDFSNTTNVVKSRNNYIHYNTFDRDCKDLKSPQIQALKKSIEKLYGTNDNKYIKVKVTVDGDDYTEKRFFSFLIPYKRSTEGVKAFANRTVESIKTYYNRLVSANYNAVALKHVQDNLKNLKRDIRTNKNVDLDKMIAIFAKNGIHIDSIQQFILTNN